MAFPLKKSYTPTTATMLPRHSLNRWLAVVVFIALVFYFHPDLNGTRVRDSTDHTPPSADIAQNISKGEPSPIPPVVAVDDLACVREVLAEHSIGPTITYASRTIKYITDAKQSARFDALARAMSSSQLRSLTNLSKLASEDLVNRNFELLFEDA